MSPDALLVDSARAQEVFDELPEELRVASLSPQYAAADAARDPGLQPLFLLWRRGAATLLHTVHEASFEEEGACDWQSPYNYGGPLAAALDRAQLPVAWRAFEEVARQRRVIAEFVRFHPVLANHHLYPGAVQVDRPVVLVDLTVKDLMGSYSGRARTAVRKALNNGLQLHWLSSQQAQAVFPSFYRDEMRRIDASDFYLFPDGYFERLLALPFARVLTVQRNTEPLAMGVFLFAPRIVEYHLSSTAPAGRSLAATNLLVHGAAQAAQDNGAIGLYLGGGTNGHPDNPLLQFKRSFGRAELHFHCGSRIYAVGAYAELQARLPELARSGRVLFYRGRPG
jgi:GNAT acetyltransferase-like protein